MCLMCLMECDGVPVVMMLVVVVMVMLVTINDRCG
jgi:hypothetical protein